MQVWPTSYSSLVLDISVWLGDVVIAAVGDCYRRTGQPCQTWMMTKLQLPLIFNAKFSKFSGLAALIKGNGKDMP